MDVHTSRFEPLSAVLGPWIVDGSLVSYKGIQGAFEQLWSIVAEIRERNREFLGAMVRVVSNAARARRS